MNSQQNSTRITKIYNQYLLSYLKEEKKEGRKQEREGEGGRKEGTRALLNTSM